MLKPKAEYFHSWYLLIIVLFSILFLFFNKNLLLNTPLMLFCFYLFFKNGLKLSSFLKYIFYAFLFSFTLFALTVMWPSKQMQAGQIYEFLNRTFFEKSLLAAGATMARIFSVSLLSMSASRAINYTKALLYLIVRNVLSPLWGYPIMLALNSIMLFKDEFERIKINARFRELPLTDRIILFFPLLVFAIRHSQRGAMSLVTRGMQSQRSYYFGYGVDYKDKAVLFLFFLLYLSLVILALFPLR